MRETEPAPSGEVAAANGAVAAQTEQANRRDVRAVATGFALGELTSLALALQFLTVVPPLLRRVASDREIGRSMLYFPLVGAGLGLALAGIDALANLAFAATVRDAMLLICVVVFTRGLHLDGLMDACDGLFGASTPERRLAIMHDSRVGSFGVLAAVTTLLLRYAALGALPLGSRLPALVMMAVLGRWSLVVATWGFPYARTSGLGSAFKRYLTLERLALATATALAFSILLWEVVGLAVFLVALTATLLLGRLVISRVSGHTGDTYGATNELVESLVLLILGVMGFW